MTSATDKLRMLLDERGVGYTIDHGYREFFWDFGETGTVRASAIGTKGLVQMIVTGVTPEQAIAATLGPGTCEDMSGGDPCVFVCSRCDAMFDHPEDERVRYCPNCGRKVVE